MAIEHDFGSFSTKLRSDHRFSDASKVEGYGTDLAHLNRSPRLHLCSTRKPASGENLAVLLVLGAYMTYLEIRVRYLEQKDDQEPTYLAHLYSGLPRLIRAVTVGSSGAVGTAATACLFSSFQRPCASVSAGRKSPITIVISRSLVANLHLQANLR